MGDLQCFWGRKKGRPTMWWAAMLGVVAASQGLAPPLQPSQDINKMPEMEPAPPQQTTEHKPAVPAPVALAQDRVNDEETAADSKFFDNPPMGSYKINLKDTVLKKLIVEIPRHHWLDEHALEVDLDHAVEIENIQKLFNDQIKPCDPACPIGQFKDGCHGPKEGQCVDCTAPPPNGTHTTQGENFKDACEWECNRGTYKNELARGGAN